MRTCGEMGWGREEREAEGSCSLEVAACAAACAAASSCETASFSTILSGAPPGSYDRLSVWTNQELLRHPGRVRFRVRVRARLGGVVLGCHQSLKVRLGGDQASAEPINTQGPQVSEDRQERPSGDLLHSGHAGCR